MKRIILFWAIISVLVSCKDEVVQKPDRLIEKETMVNIMCDLSLLEAIKIQNPASLDTFKINPNKYIYKKYKIDSVQLVKNNAYYASNYEEYTDMYNQVNDRLAKIKTETTALIKAEEKKKKPVKK